MEDLETLKERMLIFSGRISVRKELPVHKDNQFNKQFSVLLKDWHFLEIIIKRIDTADSHNATQLNLDLKSLYVFGRVFSESLLFIVSLFVNSTKNIDWEKIGPFIRTVKENIDSEPEDFKMFWEENKNVVINLSELFKYRNDVLHDKNSNTEWTFAWPGRSNLDNVYISNVPWREDINKKEKKTLNARVLIKELLESSKSIFDYIELQIDNK